MIRARFLKPRRLSERDRHKARRLALTVLEDLAGDLDLPLVSSDLA